MSDKRYVISAMIKRYGSEEYEWQYFQYDNHGGSFSTGYPCFGSFCYAKTFDTVEFAKKCFDDSKKYLLLYYVGRIKIDTLAIRIVKFKYVKGLSLK